MKKILKVNFFIYSVILVIIILTISCKTDKEVLYITQLNTNYPITLLKDKENNQIFRVFFRIPFEIRSNTSQGYEITAMRYYYSNQYGKSYLKKNDSGWLTMPFVYNILTKKLLDGYRDNLDRKFAKNNPIYIYIETQHDLDTTPQVQSELKPYIDKMIELGQDTMSIPSFKEFKKDHLQLVKDLLQGDSISVLIKKDLTKNPQLLGDTIIKAAIKY